MRFRDPLTKASMEKEKDLGVVAAAVEAAAGEAPVVRSLDDIREEGKLLLCRRLNKWKACGWIVSDIDDEVLATGHLTDARGADEGRERERKREKEDEGTRGEERVLERVVRRGSREGEEEEEEARQGRMARRQEGRKEQ